MGHTRIYGGCRDCPYRETCSHKLLIGEGLLNPAAAPLAQPLTQPLLRPHDYRHIKIDANTAITIDLEDLKKQLEESHFPPMPVISSIMNTVQSVIPAVLPVLETVVTQIGSIISAAAPVIGGLVEGIGQVISALAPVFQTIFDGIGQKVGTVLEFVGSKMGWIQEIIGQAAPLISSVLSSAWSVISPILDMAISVFQLLFNVTQTVFNGILGVVQNVWNAIQPIISSVADALSWVSSKVSGLFGGIFGGGGGGGVGANAEGTNNWRGGPTWVGEEGPELVDLPRGSRVLPNKESVQVASAAAQPQRGGTVIHLTIAKLADQIIVREDADIDRIGEAVAKKVILAIENLVPA